MCINWPKQIKVSYLALIVSLILMKLGISCVPTNLYFEKHIPIL